VGHYVTCGEVLYPDRNQATSLVTVEFYTVVRC
jgi:hypothetical protein